MGVDEELTLTCDSQYTTSTPCLSLPTETALPPVLMSTPTSAVRCHHVTTPSPRRVRLAISPASMAILLPAPSLPSKRLALPLFPRLLVFPIHHCASCQPQLADPQLLHSYLDLYTSTIPGSNASLVGKSIVVHTSNTTRLTCANFLPISNSTNSTSTTSTSNVTTTSATPTTFTGAAATNYASVGGVAAGVLAMAAFFL